MVNKTEFPMEILSPQPPLCVNKKTEQRTEKKKNNSEENTKEPNAEITTKER